MTVSELIEWLQKQPQDAEVKVFDPDKNPAWSPLDPDENMHAAWLDIRKPLLGSAIYFG